MIGAKVTTKLGAEYLQNFDLLLPLSDMGRMHTKIVTAKRKEKKLIQLKKKHQPYKKTLVNAKTTTDLRQRGGIRLLDPKSDRIPNCPHGPCLFFTDGTKKWFSCAVYRSDELCSYKVFVSTESKLNYEDARPIKFKYGDGILSKIKSGHGFKKNSIYWCQTCSAYVTLPHRDPVQGPMKADAIIQKPSKVLSSCKTDKGSAQYWFAPEVVSVVCNMLNNFDSVLCIGCPSIFEEVWEKKNAFLMDYDARFSNFYSADDFAHYSLLNHHFCREGDVLSLKKFFKKAKRLVLVVDPPFGVLLSAVENSLAKLNKMFSSVTPHGQANSIVFLPLFTGKYLSNMSIVDYKVTYTNHAQFKLKKKTVVRMFTDMDQENFSLPTEEGYRFCDICKRFVSQENQHCDKCKCCPTTFGPTFSHCDKCKKCVKPQYTHCLKCKKCHLLNRCIF